MGTRSVRLDDETEKSLAKLTKTTGLSISEVLKQGVYSLQAKTMNDARRKPYDIYRKLDLGPGGYAQTPAKNAKADVVTAIRKKHSK